MSKVRIMHFYMSTNLHHGVLWEVEEAYNN